MKKFETITSKFIDLDIENIDTDMIIPAQYLTSTSKSGYVEGLFKRLREADTNFPFNEYPPFSTGAFSSTQKEIRSILLAGDNFGCGSSREHAVWALTEFGIRVVIAPSFSDIFFNNALKNGLLVIRLPREDVSHLREQYSEKNLIIDLSNKTISNEKEVIFKFEIDLFRQHCLLNGEEDFDYLLSSKEEITKFFINKKDKNFFTNVEN